MCVERESEGEREREREERESEKREKERVREGMCGGGGRKQSLRSELNHSQGILVPWCETGKV